MNTHQVLLHLSLIEGVGPSVIHTILNNKSAQISWADLYHFSVADFMQLGITQRAAERVASGLQSHMLLEKESELIEKNNVAYCTVLDDAYPSLLKHINVPPAVIYWRGTLLKKAVNTIAIVGSRKADNYGRRVIDQIVPHLVAHDITIVSGGALGIDAMAHQATLDAGGNTIVVLGSGLLRPSPPSNIKLFNKVLESGGSMVSCFPLREEPYPGNFPARNRIISGMSRGTVVVQAAEKSGARITAQYALEQGRDVFAIPGPIDHPLSVGCNQLIQDGAKLITNAHDILIEYGITQPKQISIADQVPKQKLVTTKYPSGSIEDVLIQSCKKASSIDELAARTKLALPALQAMLFTMQLEGDLKQDFMGLWKASL